jgi:hypothetical protein
MADYSKYQSGRSSDGFTIQHLPPSSPNTRLVRRTWISRGGDCVRSSSMARGLISGAKEGVWRDTRTEPSTVRRSSISVSKRAALRHWRSQPNRFPECGGGRVQIDQTLPTAVMIVENRRRQRSRLAEVFILRGCVAEPTVGVANKRMCEPENVPGTLVRLRQEHQAED